MITLNVTQGTMEWHAARAKSHGASEAPVMMGASKRCSRSDLVRMKATGDQKEFTAWQQENLLNRGHEVEAFARAKVEQMLGDELYPLTATTDDGYLLASPDGSTMDGATGFECKLWNTDLAAAVRAGELGPDYYWQLEQQLEVCGFEKIIFVVTDGTPDKFLTMEYRAVPGRAAALRKGWAQFDDDVANYTHVEVAPKAVASPTKDLPAISIKSNGSMQLVTNLPAFGQRLAEFLAGINKEPTDDQGFADAEAAIKVLERAEAALKESEANALAEFSDIDDMRKMVSSLKESARANRLSLTHIVDAQKDKVRDDIRRKGFDALAAHVLKLNERLGSAYMPVVQGNFAGVMKGKKTIKSLQDAVEAELANAKLAANEIADRIEINRWYLTATAAEYTALFPDVATLALKAKDDFTAAVDSRVAKHVAAVKAQAEAVAEKEREKIRAEEAAKLVAAQPPAAAPVAQAAPRSISPRRGTVPLASTPPRPTDDQILAALSKAFGTPEPTVIDWLFDLDLPAAMEKRAPTAANA